MINSPLEQFNLQLLYPVRFMIIGLSIDISLTISILILLLGVFILRGLFWRSRKYIWFPQSQQLVGDMVLNFVYGTIVQQSGKVGLKYFPVLLTLFTFILIMNFIGLVPLSFTNTSQIGITATLGVSMIIGIVILGCYLKKMEFLKIFLPSNIPSVLFPFLVVIEIISFLIRPISLSLRLCANMMAGHILLNIIGSFVFSLWYYNHGLAGVIVWFSLLAIFLLEAGIAVLQAYVFLMLVCVYMNDAILVGHH